jgi:hypothetical protein
MSVRAITLFFAGTMILTSIMVPTDSAWPQNAPTPPPSQGLEAPIGKILSVAGSVTVEHTAAVVLQANIVSGVTQAKVGDFVYRGDLVQTGAGSKVDITFTDGTSFAVSSNARMTLDEFVYDPKSNSNSTLFSLAKGTFTFVAGDVAKTGNMRVDTPVGTMGIRGTTPRVEIADDGTVTFSTLVEGDKGAVRTNRNGAAPTPPR